MVNLWVPYEMNICIIYIFLMKICASGLVVKSNIPIVGPRVRFPAGADISDILYIDSSMEVYVGETIFCFTNFLYSSGSVFLPHCGNNRGH